MGEIFKMDSQKKHTWKFSRVGGVNRVNIERGDDLLYLRQLDQKLWTALSCPVHGLEIDFKTLELIDEDNDDRIRVPEILTAVEWACSVVTNPDIYFNPGISFPLSAIKTDTEEGKLLLQSAKTILTNLGKPESDSITVDDTSDTIRIFANTAFNGDGIITTKTTDNFTLQLIIDTIGSVTDRSGIAGINSEMIEEFYAECKAYDSWIKESEIKTEIILPFGEETDKAYKRFVSVESKIDDYFIRCKLAAFDNEATSTLNTLLGGIEEFNRSDLSQNLDKIAQYPISKIEANKALSLSKGINPAWTTEIAELKKIPVFQEIDGVIYITEQNWNSLKDKFKAYKIWLNDKPITKVEKIGKDEIREILQKDEKAYFLNLVEKDKELETEANNIILVDKLVRYHRDLFTLLRNFVTFFDFYSPQGNAIFQIGTLFIDQRSCNLCIKVSDMTKHSAMASMSGMFLIYCDCTSKSKNERMTIVAAMTNGDIDNLVVGRNALFYDRKNHAWDAQVVKIIENPISIRQAFFSPYRKVARFIEKQVDKFASEKDNQVHAETTGNIEQTTTKITNKDLTAIPKTASVATPAPAQPFDVAKFVGIFAAIGLAIGAIGTAIASFVAGFLGLVWWKMPFAVVGILLIISGPSMIIAYLKLRKRNLAPILDANGWAINARAIVNIPFGNTLTFIASLPKNAKLDFKDPFSEKKFPYVKVTITLLLILGVTIYYLWNHGYLKKWGL